MIRLKSSLCLSNLVLVYLQIFNLVNVVRAIDVGLIGLSQYLYYFCLIQELKDELKARQNEIVTLKDATGDVEEFQITADDDEKIPFQIGEVFVLESPDVVLSLIETKKGEVEGSVKDIETKIDAVKGAMSDLKTHLYAKFGDAINLEAEDQILILHF